MPRPTDRRATPARRRLRQRAVDPAGQCARASPACCSAWAPSPPCSRGASAPGAAAGPEHRGADRGRLVHWLIRQSLCEPGRICPYCAVVWAVTIPLLWYVTLHDIRHGVPPVPCRARGAVRTPAGGISPAGR
ncbi:vitamin K epoxide reductase family protein [Streptomyces atacamensis]|uniref:vitamin K epoxide reductase family protein n=1 Tax=Streptomyces atacamensis TaxID=531966 RepID=UPI00399D26AA